MVSIIVPVFNAAPYIPGFVATLQSFTYKVLEVIIVDDGSSDDTLNVAEKYFSDSGLRYRIIALGNNQGVSVARNKGMEAAQGEWLLFLDADDRIAPDMIAAMLDCTHDGLAEIVFCNFKKIFTASGNREEIFRSPNKGIVSAPKVMDDILWGREAAYIWRGLFKAAIISQNNIRFAAGLPLFEDAFFLLQVLNHSKNVAFTDQVLYQYIIHPASAIHHFNPGLALVPGCLQRTLHALKDVSADAVLVYQYTTLYWACLRAGQFASKRDQVASLYHEVRPMLSRRGLCRYQRLRKLKGITLGLALLKFFPKLFFRRAQKYLDR